MTPEVRSRASFGIEPEATPEEAAAIAAVLGSVAAPPSADPVRMSAWRQAARREAAGETL
ncbi:MAG: hypothetical protein IAI49_09255 [Candidatus Eremiobacteraeota bacterium]|nr:hypothetical protein [Candidatus Eremiobacteraeota bacterium]